MLGTVVSVNDRGFFFAETDSTHQSIFIHQKHVKGRRFLHLNERVSFDLAPSKIKPGEVEAVNVEVVGKVVAIQPSSAPAVSR